MIAKPNQNLSKRTTRNWLEMNNKSRGTYNSCGRMKLIRPIIRLIL